MRIVFMGTPDFSVPSLSKLVERGHDVVAVYCQPPRRAGRGMVERRSPVHEFSLEAGLEVLTPSSLRSGPEQKVFAEHNADCAVVVAYGLILPGAILKAPRLGCYNLHASKLPRWRGAAPIQRAIMAGDSVTAAAIMEMDEGLDTGPVCMTKTVAISQDVTAGELHDVLSREGAELLVETLDAIESGMLVAVEQSSDGVTYADKIDKAEARIDFSLGAGVVHNHIRGLSPFPGAWFRAMAKGKSERIKVLRSHVVDGNGAPGEVLRMDPGPVIACLKGAVRLEMVQRAGKRPATGEEFARGFLLEPGTTVG